MSDEAIDDAREREQEAKQALREAQAEAREHLEQAERTEPDEPRDDPGTTPRDEAETD